MKWIFFKTPTPLVIPIIIKLHTLLIFLVLETLPPPPPNLPGNSNPFLSGEYGYFQELHIEKKNNDTQF